MYAIIKSGGRQVKVTPGATITVDRAPLQAGDEVTLTEVLFVGKDGGEFLAGSPFVANARIVAVVEGEMRGPKIRVFKKKRRKTMRQSRGHRSTYTRILVKDILI